MPRPEGHEKLQHYIGRFMGSKEAEHDFPKQKQRAAVAYSMYRERKKKKK